MMTFIVSFICFFCLYCFAEARGYKRGVADEAARHVEVYHFSSNAIGSHSFTEDDL